MRKVYLEPVGTVRGYEDYHNEVYIDADLIGGCHFDKNQRKYIAIITYLDKKKKFYHDSINGITRNIDKWINSDL